MNEEDRKGFLEILQLKLSREHRENKTILVGHKMNDYKDKH